MLNIGAAGELAETMDDLATKQDVESMLSQQLNRILLAQIGLAGVVIGAVALIVHL